MYFGHLVYGETSTLIFLLKFLGFRSNPTKMLFQEEFADQRVEQQTHPGRTVKNTKNTVRVTHR